MAGQNKTWREIRGELPLNETQMVTYKRLMDAEARLDGMRRRKGVRDTALGDALEETEEQCTDEIYLSALARYVAELGGKLEVRAVFADETVTLARGLWR